MNKAGFPHWKGSRVALHKRATCERCVFVSAWLTLVLYRDAHSRRRVKAGRGFRARSIKPFERGRPGLRQMRALWEFNRGKERCEGVPWLCRGAQRITAWV